MASGLLIAGTFLSTAGQLYQADAEAKALDGSADDVLRASRYNARLARDHGNLVASAARAAYSKGGVEISGTAADVISETLNKAERNAYEIERSGMIRARDMKKAARARRIAGVIGVLGTGTTLLSQK